LDAIFNIDKPPGITSFGVVAAARRLSGEKRVGHGGTLDPDATGVLPVFLGKGTRLIEFLMDATKTYHARIELGVTTDTYDASGKVTSVTDPSNIGRPRVESALAIFAGDILQTPPMYSAVKHRGEPLYRYARRGAAVERTPRPARIHSITLVEWQHPFLTIDIECGKGTYIRSIAHDLGQLLGCGAILRELCRTGYGPFHIEEAMPLERLEEAFRAGQWREFSHPLDCVLKHLAALTLDAAGDEAVRKGIPVTAENRGEYEGELRRAYNAGGELTAVLRFDSQNGCWRPQKVLMPPPGPSHLQS
jgi:tRNA pseudouridine55 synthase